MPYPDPEESCEENLYNHRSDFNSVSPSNDQCADKSVFRKTNYWGDRIATPSYMSAAHLPIYCSQDVNTSNTDQRNNLTAENIVKHRVSGSTDERSQITISHASYLNPYFNFSSPPRYSAGKHDLTKYGINKYLGSQGTISKLVSQNNYIRRDEFKQRNYIQRRQVEHLSTRNKFQGKPAKKPSSHTEKRTTANVLDTQWRAVTRKQNGDRTSASSHCADWSDTEANHIHQTGDRTSASSHCADWSDTEANHIHQNGDRTSASSHCADGSDTETNRIHQNGDRTSASSHCADWSDTEANHIHQNGDRTSASSHCADWSDTETNRIHQNGDRTSASSHCADWSDTETNHIHQKGDRTSESSHCAHMSDTETNHIHTLQRSFNENLMSVPERTNVYFCANNYELKDVPGLCTENEPTIDQKVAEPFLRKQNSFGYLKRVADCIGKFLNGQKTIEMQTLDSTSNPHIANCLTLEQRLLHLTKSTNALIQEEEITRENCEMRCEKHIQERRPQTAFIDNYQEKRVVRVLESETRNTNPPRVLTILEKFELGVRMLGKSNINVDKEREYLTKTQAEDNTRTEICGKEHTIFTMNGFDLANFNKEQTEGKQVQKIDKFKGQEIDELGKGRTYYAQTSKNLDKDYMSTHECLTLNDKEAQQLYQMIEREDVGEKQNWQKHEDEKHCQQAERKILFREDTTDALMHVTLQKRMKGNSKDSLCVEVHEQPKINEQSARYVQRAQENIDWQKVNNKCFTTQEETAEQWQRLLEQTFMGIVCDSKGNESHKSETVNALRSKQIHSTSKLTDANKEYILESNPIHHEIQDRLPIITVVNDKNQAEKRAMEITVENTYIWKDASKPTDKEEIIKMDSQTDLYSTGSNEKKHKSVERISDQKNKYKINGQTMKTEEKKLLNKIGDTGTTISDKWKEIMEKKLSEEQPFSLVDKGVKEGVKRYDGKRIQDDEEHITPSCLLQEEKIVNSAFSRTENQGDNNAKKERYVEEVKVDINLRNATKSRHELGIQQIATLNKILPTNGMQPQEETQYLPDNNKEERESRNGKFTKKSKQDKNRLMFRHKDSDTVRQTNKEAESSQHAKVDKCWSEHMFDKMEGQKNIKNKGEQVGLQKWLLLLETLVNANENISKDSSNNKVKIQSESTRNVREVEIGQENKRLEDTEIGDFNLNGNVIGMYEDSNSPEIMSSVVVLQEGGQVETCDKMKQDLLRQKDKEKGKSSINNLNIVQEIASLLPHLNIRFEQAGIMDTECCGEQQIRDNEVVSGKIDMRLPMKVAFCNNTNGKGADDDMMTHSCETDEEREDKNVKSKKRCCQDKEDSLIRKKRCFIQDIKIASNVQEYMESVGVNKRLNNCEDNQVQNTKITRDAKKINEEFLIFCQSKKNFDISEDKIKDAMNEKSWSTQIRGKYVKKPKHVKRWKHIIQKEKTMENSDRGLREYVINHWRKAKNGEEKKIDNDVICTDTYFQENNTGSLRGDYPIAAKEYEEGNVHNNVVNFSSDCELMGARIYITKYEGDLSDGTKLMSIDRQSSKGVNSVVKVEEHASGFDKNNAQMSSEDIASGFAKHNAQMSSEEVAEGFDKHSSQMSSEEITYGFDKNKVQMSSEDSDSDVNDDTTRMITRVKNRTSTDDKDGDTCQYFKHHASDQSEWGEDVGVEADDEREVNFLGQSRQAVYGLMNNSNDFKVNKVSQSSFLDFSSSADYVRKRVVEELDKFVARNVHSDFEIPEKKELLEFPPTEPMFMSRKTLSKIKDILGQKVSSWLGEQICEENSSEASLVLEQEQLSDQQSQVSKDIEHTDSETNHNLESEENSVSAEMTGTVGNNLVENDRELNFYCPTVPLRITRKTKCSCVHCRVNYREPTDFDRRRRFRRTLLSSSVKDRCGIVKNKKKANAKIPADAWANSELNRVSHIQPNKRIYANRFFKKQMSLKNILSLCRTSKDWSVQKVAYFTKENEQTKVDTGIFNAGGSGDPSFMTNKSSDCKFPNEQACQDVQECHYAHYHSNGSDCFKDKQKYSQCSDSIPYTEDPVNVSKKNPTKTVLDLVNAGQICKEYGTERKWLNKEKSAHSFACTFPVTSQQSQIPSILCSADSRYCSPYYKQHYPSSHHLPLSNRERPLYSLLGSFTDTSRGCTGVCPETEYGWLSKNRLSQIRSYSKLVYTPWYCKTTASTWRDSCVTSRSRPYSSSDVRLRSSPVYCPGCDLSLGNQCRNFSFHYYV